MRYRTHTASVQAFLFLHIISCRHIGSNVILEYSAVVFSIETIPDTASMVKIAKLHGFARRRRGVLKESVERTTRRKIFQVGDAITNITLRMLTLDLTPEGAII